MSRSVKKGPFIERKLYQRVLAMAGQSSKQMLRTYSRTSTIIPEMVGLTISIYNGKAWIPVFVTENLVGHKLGAFAPPRVFRGHAGSVRKAVRR